MKKPLPSPSTVTEAVRREQAINRWIAGEKPTTICRALQRSRPWFYKALKRYQQKGRAGLADHSRAPKHVHNRIPVATEEAIERLRRTILAGEDPELRYADIGADALANELRLAEITPPSRSTINRVLVRRHLIEPRPQKTSNAPPLPDDYPWPQALLPNSLQVIDFVTRAIRGGGRVYGCNLLDHVRRYPFLRAEAVKDTETVSAFLVVAWQGIGLPDGLMMDNDAVWNGGGRGQRTLSHIVRLCLLLGIQVIFTPTDTPTANPVAESFNDLWQSNFWSRTEFRDLAHVQTELLLFEHYCRTRRYPPELAGLTPATMTPAFVPRLLSPGFSRHQETRLPITEGRVHFIRFISSQRTFSLLNEKWTVGKRWVGCTIRATVDTKAQQLRVYHLAKDSVKCELVDQFDYNLSEETLSLAAEYQREPPVAFWPE